MHTAADNLTVVACIETTYFGSYQAMPTAPKVNPHDTGHSVLGTSKPRSNRHNVGNEFAISRYPCPSA